MEYEIICITNDKHFDSLDKAATWASIKSGKATSSFNILRCCLGITKTSARFEWKIESNDETLMNKINEYRETLANYQKTIDNMYDEIGSMILDYDD